MNRPPKPLAPRVPARRAPSTAPQVAHISAAAQEAMWPRKIGQLDLRDAGDSWERRRAIGKQLREQTPPPHPRQTRARVVADRNRVAISSGEAACRHPRT